MSHEEKEEERLPPPTAMMEDEPTPNQPNENDPKPYEWPADGAPPSEVLTLWGEVGNGLEKSQTVVWKNSVESLENARKHLRTSLEARAFVEKYMAQIIGILVDQVPSKIGTFERECVHDSLAVAVQIVALDLQIQMERCGVCLVLRTLENIFSRNRNYYKPKKGNQGGGWHHHHHHAQGGGGNSGLPEIRIRMVHRFRKVQGFKWLAQYLKATIGTPHFIEIKSLSQILSAVADLLKESNDIILNSNKNKSNNVNNVNNATSGTNSAPTNSNNSNSPGSPPKTDPATLKKEIEDDSIAVGDAVMAFVTHMNEDELKKVQVEEMRNLLNDLRLIFDHLVLTRREATYSFYAFWRKLSYKLLTSESLPLKLWGWDMVNELISESEKHRPPPRTFWVQGAGCAFANGLYHFSGPTTLDGHYHRLNTDILYVRAIPQSDPEQGGHKLTLFRCTMRSQQKWWFLSEADEEQPGTDRDIDYYQHKSLKDQDEAYPPASGWTTCRNAGIDPPPTMQAVGWMVPSGEERNTLEHQLAAWAIEQKIVEQVLGDTTIHREVVARSTTLIKFLAQMCSRDDSVLTKLPAQIDGEEQPPAPSGGMNSGDDSSTKENKDRDDMSSTAEDGEKDKMATEEVTTTDTQEARIRDQYCLQASHLLYAWKTCTRKADSAVSAQVYQLLVSILPMCPPNLAIPLLQAIQKSLDDPEHNSEVVEFCGVLAEGNLIETNNNNNNSNRTSLDVAVRLEILNMMWAVLTRAETAYTKAYDSIKRYVNFEIRGEKGTQNRERFLRYCLTDLGKSAMASEQAVDEHHALLMVRLVQFIMEACPRQQADALAIQDDATFPRLLFDELKSYLTRRKNISSAGFRKTMTATSSLSTTAASSNGGDSSVLLHKNAFQDRLRMLRHVYGLSDPLAGDQDPIVVSADMIKTLWELCNSPDDRESMIIFIAGASQNGKLSADAIAATQPSPGQQQGDAAILSPAFTESVCRQIFLDLFCAEDFDFVHLGKGGYKSFHALFSAVRKSPRSSAEEKRAALDVQWRACLRVGSNEVAQQAMRDLLAVYIQASNTKALNNDPMTADNSSPQVSTLAEDFGERIFQCLSKVKEDLQNRVEGSDRAAERCIRILNASIGQEIENTYTNTPSTLTRLASLEMDATLDVAQKCLPHGLRGQSACFRVAITVRRNPLQNSTSQNVLNNGAGSGNAQTQPRPPNTSRFTLDVHPLETLLAVKQRISNQCGCPLTAIKPMHITGRRTIASSETVTGNSNLGSVPDDSVMDEIGIVHGCELVVSVSDRVQSTIPPSSPNRSIVNSNDLSAVFYNNDKFADQLFTVLMELLDMLAESSQIESSMDVDGAPNLNSTKHLVWDLLASMPTNTSILSRVLSATGNSPQGGDAMDIDSSTGDVNWSQLANPNSLNHAVYVLLTIDAVLNPAPAALSILPATLRSILQEQQDDKASDFRRHFVDSGGFAAVVEFFSREDNHDNTSALDSRRGNAVALRILMSCLFSDEDTSDIGGAGGSLVKSLSNPEGLLKSLTSMVIDDSGVSASTVMDVLRFLRLLFSTKNSAEIFLNLPRDSAKRLITSLLVKDEKVQSGRFNSTIKSSMQVRTTVSELILQTPLLADGCMPWLTEAVKSVEVKSETTLELFNTLEKLVAETAATARTRPASEEELGHLALIVCQTLSMCPRPSSESDLVDLSTGVLCGCLRLTRALVETSRGALLRPGVDVLLGSLAVEKWSDGFEGSSIDDIASLDLMGVIFDGLLTPLGNSSVAICCDKDSRHEGFDVVAAIARSCSDGRGYSAIVARVNKLINVCAPTLRHRWGEFGGGQESNSRVARTSKYSGLRNQGCTCYMNSALQQLFMMPELRNSMCSAPLPSSLRSSRGTSSKSEELVGKKITLQWETGTSYDATVENFDAETGMHVIRYNTIQVATAGSGHQQQVGPEDIERLPDPLLPDEFILAEGRPGKETGIFDLVQETNAQPGNDDEKSEGGVEPMQVGEVKENEDEAASRILLEEVQRTFIHLSEGSKGRCFDPRALVEACASLKLEFDVWQQNDASEFVTKLLDRLEASLKKYAPENFKYLDHTFGLKQTRQKICKECGMKTNKEEKMINIDCQIRGKSNIQEALATMTEADVMEGSNKVHCDNCKKKTDTLLRTAVSTLPNVLVLSLKRFDLDFQTFETVKLNSRCAFDHTLNMKPYTIEGIEEKEAEESQQGEDPSPMDTDHSESDPMPDLHDDDYEYRLAGVLVHAGVAQGGHYYSFIRDRSPDGVEKWFRFDDEDVTPFNPESIETECFGGKVKKETKWPNGQVHTVEQEQFANALMLFYEKVKPAPTPEKSNDSEEKDEEVMEISTSDGFETFKADVQQTNATHKLQSFLFDSECQNFLKDLISICRPSLQLQEEWRGPLLQMLLTYLFDVFLYSSEKPNLNDWANMLETTLLKDKDGSLEFVRKLAKKTSQVSANWFRTYLLECPDRSSREASVKVFSAAVISCASFENETKLLEQWGDAFESVAIEILSVHQERREMLPYPPQLPEKYHQLEDTALIDSGEASPIGVLFSFINVVLDTLPRCWRFTAEPCSFVRSLCNAPGDSSLTFRKALIQASVAPRIIALIVRERSPRFILATFPGASCPFDVAATQIRSEPNTSHHVMPMGSNQVVGSELKNTRMPTPADHQILFEALLLLAGLPCCMQEVCLFEADDVGHGLERVCLTEPAIKALADVFDNNCAPGVPGMGQSDIELYLKRTGVDRSQVPPQKIAELMSKYPTTVNVANDARDEAYLGFEGFLAYYKEVIQSNDGKVQSDLNIFGFRPDLTRRSRGARLVTYNDVEHLRKPEESIGMDISEILDDHIDLGTIANHAVSCSAHLYSMAFDASESLAEYLVAAAVYNRDGESAIHQSHILLHRTPNDWSAAMAITSATRSLMVIAALRDKFTEKRIGMIMESTQQLHRNVEYTAGILHVLRSYQRARQAQFNGEYHWGFDRYLGVLKELRQIESVQEWMENNRAKWSFIERELHGMRSSRGEYGQRDQHSSYSAVDNLPIDHNSHTDSDMAGPHESEDDDEDSQLDIYGQRRTPNTGPFQIVIENCGTEAVNGTYQQDGYFENACRYTKQGRWKNVNYRFFIFQCNVSNNTRHWYISIVPAGGNPGTSADIDFYTAPVNPECASVPPVKGWAKGPEGVDPVPALQFVNHTEADENDPSWVMSGDTEDNQQDGSTRQRYV